MLFSIAMDGFVLAFIVLLLFSDFKQIPDLLFWIAGVSNVVMNIFGGIYMSSVVRFGCHYAPMKYTTVLCIGLNIDFLFVTLTATSYSKKNSTPN